MAGVLSSHEAVLDDLAITRPAFGEIPLNYKFTPKGPRYGGERNPNIKAPFIQNFNKPGYYEEGGVVMNSVQTQINGPEMTCPEREILFRYEAETMNLGSGKAWGGYDNNNRFTIPSCGQMNSGHANLSVWSSNQTQRVYVNSPPFIPTIRGGHQSYDRQYFFQ